MSGDLIDPLSSEVKLTAKLDESGLSVGAKSRALSALDRIAGNFLYNLSAKGERKAIMAQAQNSAYQQVAKAAADKLTVDIGSSSPDALRILQKILDRDVRQQESLDLVAGKAVEYLALPGRTSSESDSQSYLDDDWLNMFSRLAADATSNRMRDLWGQVLAGEIRQPASFSLSTLRFMSEMDSEIAQKFSSFAEHRTEDNDILFETNIESDAFLDRHFLEEIGLVTGVSGSIGYTEHSINGQVVVRNGTHFISAQTDMDIRFRVVRLTRIGREICVILPKADPILALRDFASALKEKGFEVKLFKITNEEDGIGEGEFIEII